MTTPLEILDEAHRRDQINNATAVATYVVQRWARVDPREPDGPTARLWLVDVIRAILAGRQRSAHLAGANAQLVRRLYVPNEPVLALPPIPPANALQITKSLFYTGPVNARQRIDVIPERSPAPTDAEHERDLDRSLEERVREAVAEAGAQAAAAAMRHVQNGGRDLVDEIVRTDLRARGWVRVSRDPQDGCCHWCAMLASRGAVYREDSFAASDPRFTGPGNHKVHDNCRCQIRVVYTRDPGELPASVAGLSDLWASSTKGYSGKDAVNAFRRNYEARFRRGT